jgi:hypothetical protein
LRLNRPERGREAASEARGGDEVDVVGERGQREVRLAERDPFREASPAVKAGLELAITHLLGTGPAGHAPAAPRDEGDRNAVARAPAGHVTSDLFDHARDLVSWNVGEDDIGIVAHPAMPVAPADPVCLDAQNDPVMRQCRIRKRLYHDGAAVLPVYRGLHEAAASRGGHPAVPGCRGLPFADILVNSTKLL